MRNNSQEAYVWVIAAVIGIVLLTLFGAYWRGATLAVASLERILLGSVFLIIALVTVIVYQSFSIRKSAEKLARSIAEESLNTSHELFYELYRGSPVPYILVDTVGSIESTNLAAVRLFNVEIGALDELNIFDFILESDDHTVSILPEYLRLGKAFNEITVSLKRPDGIIRFALLSSFTFTDTQGEQKALMTLIDITKQRMVDKAKTEFVSLASHQLRTPISGMKWNIELLEMAGKDSFTEGQRTYVTKIRQSLERMDALVNDFLSASKLDMGTLEAKRAPLELLPFLESIHDEYRDFAAQKKVRIETSWESAQTSIVSDSHLLHMIVSNIWGNAVKYTREGGAVRVQVSVDATQVEIRISDTGIGIPLEDQEMIFSRLFRAQNARAQVTDGTGLGLYIVKEAVRILGGKISFESKPDVGTAFTVLLPR